MAFALFHFIYESILAPSFRFKLRHRLFALRDELRGLKIDKGDELSNEVFEDLQGSINASVARLKLIDLRLLKKAHDAFERDEKLRKRAARRNAMFDACKVVEVQKLRSQYFELLDLALMVNSGGLIIYLIPPLLGLIFADYGKNQIKAIFSLPENDLVKLAPSDTFVPA